ncbi:2-hydroxychromene-2-carboxylate isomerase [Caenispirillum salinarum AK4]|uniref:2-hydroxychromene-2-carboxylate isomerase n=1 Tax=Caenispirillum salinarum AK4 TaxID=1238182 RepID=K9HM01_9PROT|nr:DsbA family oxidoreductase [Caenispirillum salinarum]EKV31383.1 2-hydroxychromene-2-carboxylate isomerase [Caenispirillum salinarum AK4]
MPPVEITFVSDYVCPWCWLGRARLNRALERMKADSALPAEGVVVRHWPFELNPDMPAEGMDRRAYRTAKFGSWEASQALDARILEQAEADGVPFAFDRITRTPSTKAAHRLTLLVQHYHPQAVERFVDGVFKAYFVHGRDIGDVGVLGQLLLDARLDQGALLDRLRAGQATEPVEALEARVRTAGIAGVPVFAIGDRRLDGAQPVDVLVEALRAAIPADTTVP